MKRLALAALRVHLPASGPARPVFAALYGAHVVAREGIAWALRFFWYEPLFRSQCDSVGAGLRMEQLPYLNGRGRIVLGDRVRLSGKSSFGFGNHHRDRPTIRLGDDTFVGHGCGLSACESILVGRRCLLASGVRVSDFDGHPLDAARRAAGEPTPPEGVRPVVIEDDVWIGAGAVILKGVTVGRRAIVGAGAVVVKDVPADCVVAGNPASVVKRLAEAREEASRDG